VIGESLAEANKTWFPDLRRYRTELIHGEVGGCHLDSKSGKITYMHSALGTPTRALVIEDICAELSRLYAGVYDLAQVVYGHLYTLLEPIPQRTVCGLYKGRVYERDVAPTADLSFDSGTCRSFTWFEKTPGYECPLRDRCGAYARVKAAEGKLTTPPALNAG
jgi:hypothetical protein